jgi:hypothetical protein
MRNAGENRLNPFRIEAFFPYARARTNANWPL